MKASHSCVFAGNAALPHQNTLSEKRTNVVTDALSRIVYSLLIFLVIYMIYGQRKQTELCSAGVEFFSFVSGAPLCFVMLLYVIGRTKTKLLLYSSIVHVDACFPVGNRHNSTESVPSSMRAVFRLDICLFISTLRGGRPTVTGAGRAVG